MRSAIARYQGCNGSNPDIHVRPPLTQGGYLQNRHNPKPGPFRNDLSRASAGARGNRPGKALIFVAKIRK